MSVLILKSSEKMTKIYSIDLREIAVKSIEKGKTPKEVSEMFSVGIATIYRWIKQKKTRGTLASLKRPYAYRKIDYIELEKYVEQHSDQFLHEIAEHFSVTKQAIFYVLKKMKLTLKKRHLYTSKEMRKKD